MSDSSTERSLSIWFFVGLLCLGYGLVLTATGIYEFSHPLPDTIILQNLHATFWWGLLMTVFGTVYTVRLPAG